MITLHTCSQMWLKEGQSIITYTTAAEAGQFRWKRGKRRCNDLNTPWAGAPTKQMRCSRAQRKVKSCTAYA